MNGNALFWQDPGIDDDDRLDAVPTAAPNSVGAVANALADPGLRPAPEPVAAARRHLNLAPLERELLPALLMRHGWVTRNDTIEPDALQALAVPRVRAPVREHPECHDLRGVIAARSVGHRDGFGYGTAARSHGYGRGARS